MALFPVTVAAIETSTVDRPCLATLSRRFRVAIVVWLAMLGLDFLLNGGLFARLYLAGGTFLIEPAEAFRRIPFGYVAFLILALGVVELAYRLRVTQIGAGIRLGLLVGVVIGATWSLGLYSVATLSAQTAVAFGVIWLALVALACATAVAGLQARSLRRLFIQVVAFDIACVIAVVALQSFSVVPTIKP